MAREQKTAPEGWAEKGRYHGRRDAERGPEQGEDGPFEHALKLVLTTLHDNGYIPGDRVDSTAALLRAAFRAAGSDPGRFAQANYPRIAYPKGYRASMRRSTLFLAGAQTSYLLAADTGVLLQVGSTTPIGERSWTDFATEGPVLVEVFVDVFEIIMAAFGFVGNVDRLRQGATRLIFRNPALRRALERVVRAFGGSAPPDELINALRELFELLLRVGIFTDLAREFLGDWDAWDTAMLMLSLLAILFPASAAVKLVFILGKLADMGLDLAEKWDKYQRGEPLDTRG